MFKKKMVPSSQYKHKLSPYHLVVYHDQYYCIGLKDNDHRIWHYRVDLMSDINIVKEGNNSIVPVHPDTFEDLKLNILRSPLQRFLKMKLIVYILKK